MAQQKERLDVLPGLTCFWQVRERRSKIPFAEWMRLDIRYIRARTLALDMRLILQTALNVLRHRGVTGAAVE